VWYGPDIENLAAGIQLLRFNGVRDLTTHEQSRHQISSLRMADAVHRAVEGLRSHLDELL
jgi:hypothetical protein